MCLLLYGVRYHVGTAKVLSPSVRQEIYNNNNNNYYYYYYLLQLGCYSVAVVIVHVNKT